MGLRGHVTLRSLSLQPRSPLLRLAILSLALSSPPKMTGMLVAHHHIMPTRHAAVWMDHQEARIYHIDPKSFDRSDLHVMHHLRRPNRTGGHAEVDRSISEDHPFFDEVATHLADAGEVLVVGPAQTKLDFVKFVQERHKELAKKIVGVEPSDHPTDGQLVAHVRKYFNAADRMSG